MSNTTARGLRRRLNAFDANRLFDVASALDIDPQRLPWSDRTRPSELPRRLRGAIIRELQDEGRK